MGERARTWLYVAVCRARLALERANDDRLVPGVPPSPLYRLRGTPGDWDMAVMREL
jgi:hypothetical protein